MELWFHVLLLLPGYWPSTALSSSLPDILHTIVTVLWDTTNLKTTQMDVRRGNSMEFWQCLLFLLTQKSREQSCCRVDGLLQPRAASYGLWPPSAKSLPFCRLSCCCLFGAPVATFIYTKAHEGFCFLTEQINIPEVWLTLSVILI